MIFNRFWTLIVRRWTLDFGRWILLPSVSPQNFSIKWPVKTQAKVVFLFFVIITKSTSYTQVVEKKLTPDPFPTVPKVYLPMSEILMDKPIKFSFTKKQKNAFFASPDSIYTKARGYGFMPNAPTFFTLDIPEGNYDVKITIGNENADAETTIKVENRRLMLEKIQTKAGQLVTKNFTVNVRNAVIRDSLKVKLKPRELNYLHWDNQLTFEFCGQNAQVSSIEITPNTKATTVFLAGNSTVVDQAIEPYAAWGQMIPRFFEDKKIAFANHAESGETIKSFVSERRLEKVLAQIKAGDFMFIEFAHNDQKKGSGLLAFGTYQEHLKTFVKKIKKKGANPVFVTSMHRRSFDENSKIKNTLDDFPEAMRQAAKAEKIPLIDLNEMSKTLWETLGPEQAKKAFVHYKAGTFPNQEKDIADDTHFSNYGAYLLAQCMVEGIKKSKISIGKFIKKDIPNFNINNPTLPNEWRFPHSPLVNVIKPD